MFLESCSCIRKKHEFISDIISRYDGLYKVVRYYPEKGKSGFIVWRYVLLRDDPIPAPWTDEGKKRIESLGLEIVYPEGYLEFQKIKKSPAKKKRKALAEIESPFNKKKKQESYQLDDKVSETIKQDKLNKRSWSECLCRLSEGKVNFLKQVSET